MSKVSQHRAKTYEQANDYQKRLHRVFTQTEDGKELMVIWENSLKMTEAHFLGADLYALGRAEGRKEFVREIILAMKQAEGK